MGKVFHSCGHEDPVKPNMGWPVYWTEWVYDQHGDSVAVASGSFCTECLIKALQERPDEIFTSEWQAEIRAEELNEEAPSCF